MPGKFGKGRLPKPVRPLSPEEMSRQLEVLEKRSEREHARGITGQTVGIVGEEDNEDANKEYGNHGSPTEPWDPDKYRKVEYDYSNRRYSDLPNAGLRSRRYRGIGTVIGKNGGAYVTRTEDGQTLFLFPEDIKFLDENVE